MPPLPADQIGALIQEAQVAFITVDAFRNVLPTDVLDWAEDHMPERPERTRYIREVLRYVNDNEQIARVLRAMHGRTAHRGLLDRIEADPGFRQEQAERIRRAVMSLVVADGSPLINRDYLRQELIAWLGPDAGRSRLLVIPPSDAPGKSYSDSLLRHAAKSLNLRYLRIDGLVVRSGLQAAQNIANLLNLYDPTLDAQLRDNSRPGQLFVTWLTGKIGAAPAPPRAWIVFDHIDQPRATVEVESIARELATAAAQGDFDNLYVTLIESGFELRGGFGPGSGPVRRDVPATRLEKTDLARFILLWAKERGKEVQREDALADAEAAFHGMAVPLDRETTRKLVQERLWGCLNDRGLCP